MPQFRRNRDSSLTHTAAAALVHCSPQIDAKRPLESARPSLEHHSSLLRIGRLNYETVVSGESRYFIQVRLVRAMVFGKFCGRGASVPRRFGQSRSSAHANGNSEFFFRRDFIELIE